MNLPARGMHVFGVNGRRVGDVAVARETCFEVKRQARDGGDICLLATSVFTADAREGVTLMCSTSEVERYRCPDHLVQELA